MELSDKILSAAIFLMTVLAVPVHGQTAEGTALDVCSDSHALMRIDSPKRYVLLPIEDSAPESTIKVVADLGQEAAIVLRLAVRHVDYYVPLDLSPYKDRKVVLDIESASGRDGVRTVSEAIWNKTLRLSDTFDKTDTEPKWRPVYHHAPEYGWMNDPNGMFWKDGTWHLNFQYGPYGSTWNNMTWGHSTSKDLVHWTQQENTILPDAMGVIFSGSAAVDSLNSAGWGKDAVIAMYTQAGTSQFQSIAYSTDNGQTFTKYSENPVLTMPYEFRDPHLFRHDASGKWIAVIASALNHEMDIFSSEDFKTWTKESSFGKGYGCQSGVWECPDLMELPVRGTNEKKWVMICNINPGGPFGGSATQYFTGDFDGRTFTCDTEPGVTKWLDFGKDFYAAVSWNNAPEGRHTMVAWMSNWQYANDVPTKQFRSANTIARDVCLYRGEDGGLYIASTPSPEIDAAKGPGLNLGRIRNGGSKAIPASMQGHFEMDVTLNAGNSGKVSLCLGNSLGEEAVLTVDTNARTISLDRSKSGITDFSDDFPTVSTAPLPAGNIQHLRIFVDKSSIEIFEKDGYSTLTNLVFPNEAYYIVSIKGGDKKSSASAITLYNIK